jgi:ATP-binding cassette subfamily B protein
MNYSLSELKEKKKSFKNSLRAAKQFIAYLGNEQVGFVIALLFALANAGAGIITPFLIATAIDQGITQKNTDTLFSIVLLAGGIYIATLFFGYVQSRLMGNISQRALYRLRQSLFVKIQSLPLAFFNQNKAGDLISRINNDTDLLSRVLSETILRFVGNFFVIAGIGAFVLTIRFDLGIVLLASVILIVIITQILSPIIQRLNKKSLASYGDITSHLQESLSNFRAIVAFNRKDYFKDVLEESTEKNYQASLRTTIANGLLTPLYDFTGNIATIIVIIYGISLLQSGAITIGIFFAFITYTQKFYDPLRILGSLWSNLISGTSAWERIQQILALESNLTSIPAATAKTTKKDGLIVFENVTFRYDKETTILDNVSLSFEKGKTYALIGPTGGGKSTTASLMARLYDPTEGTIYFDGRELRSFNPEDLSRRIGFILQEQLLFSGTLAENILYGHPTLHNLSTIELQKVLKENDLEDLIKSFSSGLETVIEEGSNNISLGQKQLISFMRILLRKPELLIMDEATANIDTVTELALEKILAKLPASTTKVIIAHRLNTVKDADEIIFVNNQHAEKAGDFHKAISMIENASRKS